MKNLFPRAFILVIAIISFNSYAQNIPGWKTIGNANWSLKDGIIQADKGQGFIVTPTSYKDFTITGEFWRDETSTSGIFFRCANPDLINRNNAFKVNINEKNLDYPTGSIVNVAKTSKAISTFDKWTTYEITAKGNHLTVKLNKVLVVDTTSDLYKSGPIAFQYFEGPIKFRNIKIKSL